MILLDNAVKYSERGSLVSVELVATTSYAVLTVRNLSSIVVEDLPYLFDRFYRGRTRTGHPPGGSGLGLPIAKRIIEKHSGAIALAGAPDGVVEVTVRLPLQAEDRSPVQLSADSRSHAAA
jgi:signal transduction histidine kinase